VGVPTGRPIEEVVVVPNVVNVPSVAVRSEVAPAAADPAAVAVADADSTRSVGGGATKKDKSTDAASQGKAKKGDATLTTGAGTGAADKPKKDDKAAGTGAEETPIPTHDGTNTLPISSDATVTVTGADTIETVVAHTTVTKVDKAGQAEATDAAKTGGSATDKAQKKKHGDDAAAAPADAAAVADTGAAAAAAAAVAPADTNGLSVESILAHTGGSA